VAAIILPHRWTRRPSGNAEINWSNPLANGIVVALIPGANEAVRGGPVVIANGGALAPRPHGLGFTGSAWLSDDVAYAPNGYVGVGTANLTDLVVTELTGDATNFSYACGSYSGATDGVMITLRHSGVSEHWGVYAGGSLIDSTEAGVIGAGAHTFAFTRDGSTQYLYRNGVLRNSVSAANAATSTAQFCIGNILTSGGSFSVGPTANIALALRFQRFLGASEIAELTRAPWQIFRPLRRRLYFAPSSGAAEITGTAAITEAPDSISAAASVAITANASLSEVADSISAAASVLVTATATLREAADSISASAGTASFADAAIVEAADSVSAAASVAITATSAIVEQADQSTSAGTVAIIAAAALQEQADRISAEGGSASFATAALVEAADALAATGTVLVTGTGSLAEQADSLASAGTVSLTATAALLEAADTIAASGSVGTVVSTADAALVEALDTSTGAATVAVTGAAAIVEAGDIIVSGVSLVVTATAVLIEQADSITATGSALNALTATASLIEANDTMTATVVQKIARRIAVSDAISGGRPAASDARRWTITPSDGLN